MALLKRASQGLLLGGPGDKGPFKELVQNVSARVRTNEGEEN